MEDWIYLINNKVDGNTNVEVTEKKAPTGAFMQELKDAY